MLGSVKDGGRCAKNEDGVWLMGRWRERIGCKGEVGVLGGVEDGMQSEKCMLRCVKDGGMGEKGVFRDVKNGSGGEIVGARTCLMGTIA